MNRRYPRYPDDADYQTNSPSYYDDLARKQKLIQLLAEKIWEYENTLNETLEQIEQRLTDYILENDLLMNERLENWDQRIDEMPEEMRSLFVTWLNDGTLEQIINHDVLGNKADKMYVDHITIVISETNDIDDTEKIQNAIDRLGYGTVQLSGEGNVFTVTNIVLKNNVRLTSDKGVTVRRKTGSTGSLIYSNDANNLQIDNLFLDGVDKNHPLINITGGNNHTIEDVTGVNGSFGITLTDVKDVTIQHNDISNCKNYGIFVNSDTIETTNFNILNNTIHNVKNTTVKGLGVDGAGIMVRGKENDTPKLYVRNGIINGNISHHNGRSGITIVCGDNVQVVNNQTFSNNINTDIGSGIIISAGCTNITVNQNISYDNHDAGILIDVATDTPGESILFGDIIVTDNIVYDNQRTGIKNNNSPKINISNNQIKGGIWGVFANQNTQYSIISKNKIEKATQNGIRLIGNVEKNDDQQKYLIISENILVECATETVSNRSALSINHYENVKVLDNIFIRNGFDLYVNVTVKGLYLINNLFTTSINIMNASSVKKWDDDFRESLTGDFFSNDFVGNGKTRMRINDGQTINHFGSPYVPIYAVATITTNLEKGITEGYAGQKIQITNIDNSPITIKNGGNVRNIDQVDVVLGFGEMVEYTYRLGWFQTGQVIKTGL